MNTVDTVQAVRDQVQAWRNEGYTVGLVPTMGYLHEGHASLIRRARKETDKVVVSIFVNPTQFGEHEDLDSYPRDLSRDQRLCENMGADLIFHPEPAEMYQDPRAFVSITGLSDHLCGKSRPIHFQGVCTVVSKLFHIVCPDRAYFGQKDAQQLAIIRKMVQDLNFNVEVVGCPIVREADGLAKSSRNIYLSPEERQAALCLSRAVRLGEAMAAKTNDAGAIRTAMRQVIEAEPLARIDYIEIVNAVTMEPVMTTDGGILAALAVYIGKTRLIDNFMQEGK